MICKNQPNSQFDDNVNNETFEDVGEKQDNPMVAGPKDNVEELIQPPSKPNEMEPPMEMEQPTDSESIPKQKVVRLLFILWDSTQFHTRM